MFEMREDKLHHLIVFSSDDEMKTEVTRAINSCPFFQYQGCRL